MRTAILLQGLAILGQAGPAWAADLRLEGVVVSHHGDPVAGAGVFWIRMPTMYGLPVVVEGTTGPDGRFALRGADVPMEIDVRRTVVWIHAERHGLARTVASSLLIENPDAPPTRVVLPAETETSIRVTADDAGQPLAGIRVEPVLPLLPAVVHQPLVQTSDPSGLVRFPAIPTNMLRQVRIVSDELGTQLFDLAGGQFGEAPPQNESTIIARPTGRVDVRFVSEDGLKLGNVKLLAVTTVTRNVQGKFAQVFEAPEGFTVPALAAGRLRFQTGGCAPTVEVLPHWPEEPLELAAGEHRTFDVPLERTVTIRGRVLDRETERPCAGALVNIYTRHAACSTVTYTDQDGRYSMNVLKGPVAISVSGIRKSDGLQLSDRGAVQGVAGATGGEMPDVFADIQRDAAVSVKQP